MSSATVCTVAQDCGIDLKTVNDWWLKADKILSDEGRGIHDQDYWSKKVSLVKHKCGLEGAKAFKGPDKPAPHMSAYGESRARRLIVNQIMAEYVEEQQDEQSPGSDG